MGKRILLADDSITIQKVIELTFSDEDFDVVTVGNGRLAIDKIQELRPDLVLCDIIMPEKDGYEVCDFVKRNPALAHVPVLLLTGAFEPFDQERAARVGCDGFLAKPFEPQALIAKVKDLLSRVQVPEPAATPAAVIAEPAPAPVEAPAPSPAPSAASRVAPFPQPAPPPTPHTPVPEPFFAGAAEPERPPAAPPPPVAPPAALEEPEVQFIPEEPFAEPVEFRSVEDQPTRVTTGDFGYGSPFDDYEVASFDQAVPVATPDAPEVLPVFEAIDAGMEELLPISAEEAETLAVPAEDGPAVAAPGEGWTQPTVEVSLEDRARASVEAAHMSPEPFFEEVFEEEPLTPEPRLNEAPGPEPDILGQVALEREDDALPMLLDEVAAVPANRGLSPAAVSPSHSEAVPAPVSAPTVFEPEPPVQPSGTAAPEAAASVSPDMMSEVAQRVVAQMSEKIIREIAWEVIPDLAEALIKKEIERLKAELTQS